MSVDVRIGEKNPDDRSLSFVTRYSRDAREHPYRLMKQTNQYVIHVVV